MGWLYLVVAKNLLVIYCPNFAGLNTSSGSVLVVCTVDACSSGAGATVLIVLVPRVIGSCCVKGGGEKM